MEPLQTEGSVHVRTQELLREEPALTKLAFARLLEWLDDGVDTQGESYLEMRRRLVAYFDRRNRPAADELADETLTRIGRTLEQGNVIVTRPPARYCYVVAKFVLLEDIRRDRRQLPLDERYRLDHARARGIGLVGADDSQVAREQRLDCLDRCLDGLRPDQRELAIEYYRDARRQRIEHRRGLAEKLGISMNALGIRACRIRDTLKTCMEGCRKEGRRI